MVSEAIRLVGDDGSALRARLESVLALALVHSGRLDDAHAARDRALQLARSHDEATVTRSIQAALISEQDPHRLLEWAARNRRFGATNG